MILILEGVGHLMDEVTFCWMESRGPDGPPASPFCTR